MAVDGGFPDYLLLDFSFKITAFTTLHHEYTYFYFYYILVVNIV